MPERPEISTKLDSGNFRRFYYLKEELVAFCRACGLPSGGGKIEIADRIAHYLDSGEITAANPAKKAKVRFEAISENSEIEPNFVCSEKHRAFFIEKLGVKFSFNVAFQKWLKSNAGKTYAQAVEAYYQILEKNRHEKTTIDRQFEYNTYIRDFFADNKGQSLEDAIMCWKHKKSLPGHNRYEKTDLLPPEN